MPSPRSHRIAVGSAFVLGALALLAFAPVTRIECRRERAVACEATASILGLAPFQRIRVAPVVEARVDKVSFRSGGRGVTNHHLAIEGPGGVSERPWGLQRRPEKVLRPIAETMSAFLSDGTAKEMTPVRHYETFPNIVGTAMFLLGLMAMASR